MLDPLKTQAGQTPGELAPRFVYRRAPPPGGGTAVMIAAAVLIALALFYLVFSNLP